MKMQLRCDNCGCEGEADDRELFIDLRERAEHHLRALVVHRLDIGGTFTPFECVGCGALAYPIGPDDDVVAAQMSIPDGPVVQMGNQGMGSVNIDISATGVKNPRGLLDWVNLWVDHHEGKTQVVCMGTDEDDSGEPLVCLKLTPDYRNIETITVRKDRAEKIKIQ